MRRPQEKTPAQLITELFSRVRQLEDNRFFPPRDKWFDGTCTAVAGRGEDDNPYQVDLRFDPDTSNQIECREDGLFVGGGQVVGWDAVVDSTIVASEPEVRLFQGIGEALTYLAGTVGLTSASIAVRPGTYTEAANWTPPAQYYLFGIRGTAQGSLGEFGGVVWVWNTFKPTVSSSAVIDNFTIDLQTGGAFTLTTQPFSSLSLTRCHIMSSSSYPTSGSLCAFLNATRSQIELFGSSTNRTLCSNKAVLTDCDVLLKAGSADLAWTIASAELIMTGGRVAVQGSFVGNTVSFNLPVDFSVEGMNTQEWAVSGSDTLPGRFVVPAGARGYIHVTPTAHKASANWDVVATSGHESLELHGAFRNITCTGGHSALVISGMCYSPNGTPTWDITGPCSLNMIAHSLTLVILRSRGIVANISCNGHVNTSGTLVSFVAAEYCNVHVGARGSAAGGTFKAYNLDASSVKNILTFAGASTFPVAGTDSGTDNQITET